MSAKASAARGLEILFVGTLPPHPGGSAISSAELIVGLAAHGNSIRALAPITRDALESGDQFAQQHPEIDVRRFVVPWFDVAAPVPPDPTYRKLESAQTHGQFARMAASRRPDVVLIGRESFAFDVPELAARHRLPSVMIVRGGKRTTSLLDGGYPDNLANDLLREYRKVTRIVTVAPHLAERVRHLGFENVTCVCNAIDTDRFAPRPKRRDLLRQLNIDWTDTVAMHIANLQERKRSIDVCVSARAALARNPQLVYVVVGDGALKDSMINACRSSGVSDRFRFTGWIDYARMPEIVNLADLVLLPSESEGRARVYLETQACGRVLIASDIVAAREMVVDGETGLLCRMGDLGDLDDLTEKVVMASNDTALRERIGRNARKAATTYRLDNLLMEYSTLLRSICLSS